MKKFLLFLVLLWHSAVFAQTSSVTSLPSLTSGINSDLFYVVRPGDASPNRKMTLGDLRTSLGVGTGSVTSITAGSGLSGGTVTGIGTFSIATGGVTNAMLAGSIDLGTKMTGVLPFANLPTGAPPGSYYVWVSSGTGTGIWKLLPSCPDTGGNHLNYVQGGTALDFVCGSTSSGGGGGGSGSGNISGSGTLGKLAIFTGTATLGASASIQELGGITTIGTGSTTVSLNITSAPAGVNTAIKVPASATPVIVAGMSNPSDSNCVLYIDLNGVQQRGACSGGGGGTVGPGTVGQLAIFTTTTTIGSTPLFQVISGQPTLGTVSSKSYVVDLTNAPAGNTTVTAPNSATPVLVAGIANPSDSNCVQYINTLGAQVRGACGAGGGTPGGSNTQLQYNNAGALGGITGTATDGANVVFSANALRATSPRITTGLNDANGLAVLDFTATGSAVNRARFGNSATGGAVLLDVVGSDTNISIRLAPKGTGKVQIGDPTTNGLTLATSAITGQKTITAQNLDGTLPVFTVTPTDTHCVSWVVSGGTYKLGTSGAPCGGGGGGAAPGGSDGAMQYRVNSTTLGGVSTASSDGTNMTFTAGGLRATSPRFTTSLFDTNGASFLDVNPQASATNRLRIGNASTGNSVLLDAVGGDTNINLRLAAKGSGKFQIGDPTTAGLTVATGGITGQKTHTWQNLDGTVPLFTGTPVNDNCAKWVVSAGTYKLGDAGAACGSGGGSSYTGLSSDGTVLRFDFNGNTGPGIYPRGIVSRAVDATPHSAHVGGQRARGTAGSPTAVLTNDYIAAFTAEAYDGAAYRLSGYIGWITKAVSMGNYVDSTFVINTGEIEALLVDAVYNSYTTVNTRLGTLRLTAQTGVVNLYDSVGIGPGAIGSVDATLAVKKATGGTGITNLVNVSNNSNVNFHIDIANSGDGDLRSVIGSSTATHVVIKTNGVERLRVGSSGGVSMSTLQSAGSATGKFVVCADAGGTLYRSSSGSECQN